MRQQRVCILLFSGKSGKNVSRERNCATLRFPSERIFYNWQSFQFDCCVVQCIECFARVLTIITLFFKQAHADMLLRCHRHHHHFIAIFQMKFLPTVDALIFQTVTDFIVLTLKRCSRISFLFLISSTILGCWWVGIIFNKTSYATFDDNFGCKRLSKRCTIIIG